MIHANSAEEIVLFPAVASYVLWRDKNPLLNYLVLLYCFAGRYGIKYSLRVSFDSYNKILAFVFYTIQYKLTTGITQTFMRKFYE